MPRRVTDPYEVLGLDRGATETDVRAAYLRLAKKHHPDKNPGDKASEWIFKEVQSAYESLLDVKAVSPGGRREPPPSRSDRAERDGPEHGRRREQRSKRPDREEHRRRRWQQPQSAGKHSARVKTPHATRERGRADSTVRRTLRWAKWTVYGSNALLWPLALAGRLEWLPDLVGGLAFGWMTLGSCTLAWDFVLKGAIKDAVEQARRETRER